MDHEGDHAICPFLKHINGLNSFFAQLSLGDNLPGILYNFPMKTIEEILQVAKHLPLTQRLTLAHRLLVSSEPSQSSGVDEAWDLAIRERIMRYDQGRVQTRPASEVFSELDDKLSS